MNTEHEMFVAIAEIDDATQRTRRAVADLHLTATELKQKFKEFIAIDSNLDSLKVAKNKMTLINQTSEVLYDEIDSALFSVQGICELFDSVCT